MKNKILVCFHKKYTYKYSDIYYPILGGASSKKDFVLDKEVLKDNTNINMSDKNPYYSELTALYWGWKNLEYDNLGLVHYRRYFKGKEEIIVDNKKIKVISNNEIDNILSNYDVIVPNKRKYYIETLFNHYCRTLRSEPMYALKDTLKKYYPEYLDEYNRLKKRRSAHMFNMMIGTKEFINGYCTWLFDVLEHIEHRINSARWGEYEKRYMGSVSELMLDIYINKNKIKYKEVKVIELIPFAFIKKAFKYLKTKIFGKKYIKSDR